MPNKKKEKLQKLVQEQIHDTALDYIIDTYFLYKVCEGCDAILFYEKAFCPICRAYRFDNSFKRIAEQVEIARKSPEAYLDF